MYTRRKFTFKDMIRWTRLEILLFGIIAIAWVVLFQVFELHWLQLPWAPIALIGTAVAFLIGFQNNAAYDRAWEARKIWGGIVNESRTMAMMIKAMVTNQHAEHPVTDDDLAQNKPRLIHRHLAWVTALRHAMRESRSWETFTSYRTNREWHEKIDIPERDNSLECDLSELLSEDELSDVLHSTNKSAAILALQSSQLRSLMERGLVWEFSFLELEGQLRRLFELQGRSERIKNYPYPRQYASLSYDLVRIFVALLPFGVIPEFARIGEGLKDGFPFIGQHFVWVAVPFSVILAWVFHTMQRIAIVGENPFEGSANDVPISTIARSIEIDLREMNGEPSSEIPEPLATVHGVQM